MSLNSETNTDHGAIDSTPLQAALAFPVKYQALREVVIVYTTSYSLSYNVIRLKKRGFLPFLA